MDLLICCGATELEPPQQLPDFTDGKPDKAATCVLVTRTARLGALPSCIARSSDNDASAEHSGPVPPQLTQTPFSSSHFI